MAQFKLEVSEHRNEIGVSAAFAVAVDAALNVGATGLDSGDGLATATSESL